MYTTFGRDTGLNAKVSALTHIGLIGVGAVNWRAATFTEATFTNYVRVAAPTFAAAADSTPAGARQRASSAEVNFAANGGSVVTLQGYFGADAVSGGNILFAQPFSPKAPFVAIARPTAEDIYAPNVHTLVANDTVYVMAAAGLPLPTGLVENTLYHVIAAGLTDNEFRLSETQGGGAVDITSVGGLQVIPASSRTLDPGAWIRMASGAITLSE